ncbi:MAG TPA: galactokinase [Myxococcaceae bacterium]|nr:galactokinase [Myxococcaceae bacterium]
MSPSFPSPHRDPAARAERAFRDRLGRAPRLFRAPGRVNLIGEHTDYNDGFVLPLAIEASTCVAAAPRGDRRISVDSLDLGARLELDLDGARATLPGQWGAYVEGVARVLEARGIRLGGADLVIASDVPIGAGLSSSAALEIASGLALLAVSSRPIDRIQLALAAQESEHDYVGTRCGIMDQLASALAEEDRALLIDCRSLEARTVPLRLPRHAVVIFDTGVKHALAAGEYNARRGECERGVALLREILPEIRALRDVTEIELERYGDRLPERVLRRCRHVVGENARTLAAVVALERGALEELGRLMAASHASLRDDYEVSCAELDALVEIASSMPGVTGARMTGGGFGGCTVNLVEREALSEVIEGVAGAYQLRFGRKPQAFVTKAAGGAGEIVPDTC